MRVRNFEQLRKDILPCVKEIRMQSCKKFVDSMFSKKFWSTFLNKEENRDIKTIWESLPSLNGKILQKKSVKDMVTTVENSSDVYESDNEKMQSEEEEEDDLEDLETDFSILPEKAQRGYWAEDDKKEKRDAAQVQEFMDQIDYNDLQMPVQGFSYDSEDLPGEAPFGCSQEAPIRCSQDRPDERSKTNFLDDFWDAWNQRASSKDAFPLTLSQDSHKPAYFSTLK